MCKQCFFWIILCSFFFSCKKDIEELELASLSDYQPLKTGKVWIYRLDSTIVLPGTYGFGIKSYHAMDSIAASYTDLAGRASFTVLRYLRDTLNTDPWEYSSTYTWSLGPNDLQLNENGLRYIKLVRPIQEGTTWNGNAFIDTRSPSTPYSFMFNWQYNYQDLEQPFHTRMGSIPNTVTVMHVNETEPNEPFSTTLEIHERSFSKEVYAKGLGMVYKEYIHWSWQRSPQPNFSKETAGIKLSLISYK